MQHQAIFSVVTAGGTVASNEERQTMLASILSHRKAPQNTDLSGLNVDRAGVEKLCSDSLLVMSQIGLGQHVCS